MVKPTCYLRCDQQCQHDQDCKEELDTSRIRFEHRRIRVQHILRPLQLPHQRRPKDQVAEEVNTCRLTSHSPPCSKTATMPNASGMRKRGSSQKMPSQFICCTTTDIGR